MLSVLDNYTLDNPDEIAKAIANDFRKRRIEKNLTREQVSEKAGVAVSNICLLYTSIYSYQFKTLILPGSGNHPIGYEIGSDYTKTYFIHILSYYVLRLQMYDFCLT